MLDWVKEKLHVPKGELFLWCPKPIGCHFELYETIHSNKFAV